MFETILKTGLQGYGLSAEDEQIARLRQYAEALRRENEVQNLTTVTDPDEIAVRHMLDSLALLRLPELQAAGARVIDVGCGAGFPGAPLKLARPELQITLLDATEKRCRFVRETLAACGTPAPVLYARAEEFGRGEGRAQFDVAVSRAVAALPALCELCLPLLRVGGAFLAMKNTGEAAEEEIDSARNAIGVLGAVLERREPYQLPGEATPRQLLVIRKRRDTDVRYPRTWAAIKKRPI